MKNKKPTNQTKSKLSIFRQICNLIPTHLASKLARETNAEEKSGTFTPWSHVVSLFFAQFTHSIGLNDVCDGLKLTNHFEWSPSTVADLYRCRWEIEVFFKQIKQTLQLASKMPCLPDHL